MAFGKLVLAATPIGNVQDASPRLRELLSEANVIAAEDTRKLRDLARRLGVEVRGRVISCFEHNEAARADELLDVVADGGLVVLVSDAGMPAVSDPGYRLVSRAIERDVPVTTAPGPSAVLAALAVSGLPSDRFTFEGFLPRKTGERAAALAALADGPRTMVFFESPHRIEATLVAMATAFGPERRAALCRELTKTYEEVLRGPLGDIASTVAERAASGQPIKGEICLVVAGAELRKHPSLAELVTEVQHLVNEGHRLKEAVKEVAEKNQISRRELYNEAVRI